LISNKKKNEELSSRVKKYVHMPGGWLAGNSIVVGSRIHCRLQK